MELGPKLQLSIIEQFKPRFAPEARVLYQETLGNEPSTRDMVGFEYLGCFIPDQNELPSLVFYDEIRNLIFLIEVVTSHGPITPKRYSELKEAFKWCSAELVYISAFPNFSIFKNFLTQIAWETEVWLAEIPDHLIHFNGDRFLGPPPWGG